MQVEHEIDQGPLELRARAHIDGEPRAGYFRGPVKVENPKIRPNVPMRLRFERKARRLPHPPDFHIVISRTPCRHGLMRNIRYSGEQRPEFSVYGVGLPGKR